MFTNLKLWIVVVRHNFKWENSLYLLFETRIFTNLDVQTGISVPTIMIQATKTHHYIIFSLSDHYILSREWRIIVDQVQTNHHSRHMVL